MAWIQYKKYDHPDREKFKQYRETAFGLGVKGRKKCSQYLYVTDRTVQAWEYGESKIPYATFKLVRMKATGRLLDSPEFEGFHIKDGTIYTNANEGFDHGQLKWLSLYMSIARKAIRDYQDNKFIKQLAHEEALLRERLRVRPRVKQKNRLNRHKKAVYY